jgi:hypothetical protein
MLKVFNSVQAIATGTVRQPPQAALCLLGPGACLCPQCASPASQQQQQHAC